MAKTGVRVAITLACTECRRRNYQTMKSKRNDPDRVEFSKFCRRCGKHTAHLEPRIESMGQRPRFRRVVVPTEQVIETKDGQKVQAEKRVLPGYVLVNMDLNDDAWTVVKNTPGVTGFVGAGSKPVPLSPGEVDRILKTGAATAERPRAQVEFQLGESVKVTSGPLSDFDGEIVDVNADQQKPKVLVDIFERQVPVELGFDQVKKID